MEEIIKKLEERRIHLKTVEMDYFDKAHDSKFSWVEKLVYRGFSNEFCARADELSEVIKLLK
jgi:hypothetical protein